MQKRKLGKSDLEFVPIAFGGNVFGWTADEATSHTLLDAFVDAGFSFVDTADVYSAGESEEIVGKALKGRRDGVVRTELNCGTYQDTDGKRTRA